MRLMLAGRIVNQSSKGQKTFSLDWRKQPLAAEVTKMPLNLLIEILEDS